MSQTKLGMAALDTVDQNTAAPRISKYEHGVNFPKFDTIEQLAKALDLPPAYFLTGSDELAKAILLFSGLSPDDQQEALAVLARLDKEAKASGKGANRK